MNKVLVTGGAGFIGSNLVGMLISKGYEVYIIDNFSTGHKSNLEKFKLRIINEDLINIDKIHDLPRFDCVFHLAASVGRQKSIDFPIQDTSINLISTIKLLQYIVKNSIPKIIYSSSAAIYGELKKAVIDEDHQLNPDSPYGVSKLAAEKMVLAYSNIYNFNAVALRYFNVYGINQRYDLYGNVIPIFVNQINKGLPVNIYGDGNQTRDFLNVQDVAIANIKAAQSNTLTGAFNLGSGTSISINELVDLLQELYKKKIERNFLPPRKGDVLHCSADITKIKKAMNFNPNTNLKIQLSEYIKWSKTLEF